MARFRARASTQLNRDAQRLVALATGLDRSGSRVEDRYWEEKIAGLIPRLLQEGQDETIESALEHLVQGGTGAYEVLIEQAETLSESVTLVQNEKPYDVLLLVAPLVAFTRYAIPSGPLAKDVAATLATQLHRHILADGVKLGLMPHLVSVDQMPRTFAETWEWLQALGMRSLGHDVENPTLHNDIEANNMLADTRYVIGAVSVPSGEPVFRWQRDQGSPAEARDRALAAWVEHTQATFASLMTGCGFEALLPDAYYVSNREADRQMRPLSLKAAVNWLQSSIQLEPSELRAVVGGCGEERIDEYRISFTARESKDVLYGCVWPLYGREDENIEGDDQPTVVEEIAALLKGLGVAEVRQLPGLLPLEYCEDCGAPYFPNPLGEMVHAGLPDDATETPQHFH